MVLNLQARQKFALISQRTLIKKRKKMTSQEGQKDCKAQALDKRLQQGLDDVDENDSDGAEDGGAR